SVSQDALARTGTSIDIHRDTDEGSVAISGDGRLAHEATRVGEHRLVIGLPQVSSAVRKPFMNVSHRLLKQIRGVYHPGRVRVVLELANRVVSVIERQAAALVVKLTDATAGENGGGRGPAGLSHIPLAQKTGDAKRGAVEGLESKGIQKAHVVLHRSATAF